MSLPQRIGEKVNSALRTMLSEFEDLYLLGEDIEDPYGGAFKITKGLSSAHPARVIGTPISESAIVGVANGLALTGNRVVVEIMFGDFIPLAFDQLVNFTSKSVAMYGRPVAMPVVVRCPVGGRRGYGPTHSQSLQKHFIGVPNLRLIELSAYHDPEQIFREALGRREPSIVFEPKHLYGAPYAGTAQSLGDGNWAHIAPDGRTGPKLVVLSPGGTADLAVRAGRELASAAQVHVLVPAQIYPLNLDPIADLVADADAVFTLEESTAGGTWGAEVAAQLQRRFSGQLRRAVVGLHSADDVVPAAPHLEQQVLVQERDVLAALRAALGTPVVAPQPGGAAAAPFTTGHDVVLPKLNNNDDTYLLLDWLVPDGDTVAAGDVIAEIETSKAVEALPAAASGTLRYRAAAGDTCAPGDLLAVIGAADDLATPAPVPEAPRENGTAPDVELTPAQRRIAAVVSRSRREIPDAFVVYKASLEPLTAALREVKGFTLLDVLVKQLGRLRPAFPNCFAALSPDGNRLSLAEETHAGVTMDAGSGLFIPVVHGVEALTLTEVADRLSEYRRNAFSGRFAEQQLSGATIAVSWNHWPGVVTVQPVIPPGLTCAVSVGGGFDDWSPDGSGGTRARKAVHLALAHDHRVVNGTEAVRFLEALAALLNDAEGIAKLLAE